MESPGTKKAHDADVLLNGRLKRSRYGSANETISGAVSMTRNMTSECQVALELLTRTNKPEEEEPSEVEQEPSLVEQEPSVVEQEPHDFCQCPCTPRPHSLYGATLENATTPRPLYGATLENAVTIDDDDDDDLEVIAFIPRPVLTKTVIPINEPGKVFREEGHLTAEDICGHQKGIRAIEDEVSKESSSNTTTEAHVLLETIKVAAKEVKSYVKRLKTAKRKSSPKNVQEKTPKEKTPKEKTPKEKTLKEKTPKEKTPKEVEDVDDERIFLSPRHKKMRDVVYADSDQDEPDYEVQFNSDSDRELTPEPEDPFDDIWKECDVMQRQTKRQEDGEEEEVCEHIYEIKNDVGRACSLCGLIKEDIKDMMFTWRRPCTVRKAMARGERTDAWDTDEEGALEEELKLEGMPPLEAHLSLEQHMHPHQLEGFKLLSRNLVEEDSGGCMLAFAPGTGKSFLVICFIQSFMVRVPNARPMIVAPKSMLRPWMQEFKKWQVEEIKVMNLYEADNQLEMLKEWQETSSVLLVGYSQFTNMNGELGRYFTEGPGLMVLDEGHLARTESTKILKSLTRVHTKRRILLSGTPFNNNFEEFYTTLELVRPGFMHRANPLMEPTLNTLVAPEPKSNTTLLPVLKKSSNAGRQAFKDVIGEKFGQHDNVTRALKQLRVLIEPFVAWHKGQILETLPGITDLTIMLELSQKQRELLKENDSDVRDNLKKRAAAIYVHPILEPVGADGSKRSEKDPRLKSFNIDVKDGAKLNWVLNLIDICDAAGEKVLIFSEYLYTLGLIENWTQQRMKWCKDTQILRLDGKLPPHEREKIIDKFNNDPEARMLCASIKACGEGISLVGASRVVILEVVWNHAVTRQAISRAFRIGQQKKVVVYRLVAADTHEENRMHAAATHKEWLSKLLFDPSINCDDPNSILWDVTDDTPDSFLKAGTNLREGVKKIYEREF